MSDSIFHLDTQNPAALRDYLSGMGFSEAYGALTIEKAGEGNMNCVLRVRTPERSLIVKQARPWVEKYPSIAAPVERAAAEAKFYAEIAKDSELSAAMPGFLDFDPDCSVLILEDVAPAVSLAECYAGEFRFDQTQLMDLGKFLQRLHGLELAPEERPAFRNFAMRRLNHEHIFDLPLRRENGLGEMLEGLTPGLGKEAAELREEEAYTSKVHQLGERYLMPDGDALLHGDFFPGSILLRASGQLCVLDPEFSYCGDPEFDFGVFLAHLALSGHDETLIKFWSEMALEGTKTDGRLLRQYAGVEIMRRLLGVAQLPIERSLEEKRLLLQRSREWVLG